MKGECVDTNVSKKDKDMFFWCIGKECTSFMFNNTTDSKFDDLLHVFKVRRWNPV